MNDVVSIPFIPQTEAIHIVMKPPAANDNEAKITQSRTHVNSEFTTNDHLRLIPEADLECHTPISIGTIPQRPRNSDNRRNLMRRMIVVSSSALAQEAGRRRGAHGDDTVEGVVIGQATTTTGVTQGDTMMIDAGVSAGIRGKDQ